MVDEQQKHRDDMKDIKRSNEPDTSLAPVVASAAPASSSSASLGRKRQHRKGVEAMESVFLASVLACVFLG